MPFIDKDGTFWAAGLAPGEYKLEASLQYSPPEEGDSDIKRKPLTEKPATFTIPEGKAPTVVDLGTIKLKLDSSSD